MFKLNKKPPIPAKVSESFFSPVFRRRILKYEESISQRVSGFSSSIHSTMYLGQHLAGKGKLPSIRNHCEGKFKTQTQKLFWKSKNSRWTKIRHSLDFIRKWKESQKFKKLERTRSLTFLGQLYGDSFMDDDVAIDEYDTNLIL